MRPNVSVYLRSVASHFCFLSTGFLPALATLLNHLAISLVHFDFNCVLLRAEGVLKAMVRFPKNQRRETQASSLKTTS